ncbi:MAG: SLBB domain-containing protein [Chitinispirillaceae bacterium]
MKKTLLLLFMAGYVSSAIIKPGDVLNIRVVSHREFSGRYTVSQNGRIDYPLLADEKVSNVSTSELMAELSFRLAKHIDNPLVLVSVVENPEIAVSVLGQVQEPGPVVIHQGATLQEVIHKAGGPTEDADLAKVRIIYGGRTHGSEYFDFKEFLSSGNMDQMPRLNNNDMVVVLARSKNKKVKVIGSVQKPGMFDIDEKTNIFEAIYLAGGPVKEADLSKVRRLSQNEDERNEEIIDVQAYIDNGQMDSLPLVKQGDVVLVYSKWFDWQTFMTVTNNVLLFLVTLQTFAGLFK